MSHEIEADFVYHWENEAGQCKNCTSFSQLESDKGFCSESKTEVPSNAHCDFFQSRD